MHNFRNKVDVANNAAAGSSDAVPGDPAAVSAPSTVSTNPKAKTKGAVSGKTRAPKEEEDD
ncbi:uncharacterized protein BCR38DRAFT_490872 [Pseudomassariella vexata]|uniref:Uncharacterized protein n=1 Tax=Pseudomassariella vexata TaxID=1141098 RepID=A0A1Y2D9I8_9PEZI|nr:uncharacterized protein BCR38DRAFT_490872 [Pseudomassariella vexata]ORY55867.1 hypothetical protein BCR38DRAFT_490872 [Pseudomassariella vexata]